MKTELTRRSLFGLGAVSLAGLGAAGCSGSGGGSSGPRATWYGGEPVHGAMQKCLQLFEEKSGTAVSETHGPFDSYWDKLATETAGGSAPDVMRMSMSYFADYADRGALLDLTGHVGESIKTEPLDDDVVESGKVDGTFYGIGQSAITHAVFVDPELIDSLGVPQPSSDWTWDSYADWCKEVGAAGGGDVYGSADVSGGLQTFEHFALQNGQPLFASDGRSLGVDADVVQQWWQYWRDMRDERGAPPPDVTAAGSGFENAPITKGIAPASFGWVQQITFLQALNKHDLQVMRLPAVDGGQPGHFLKALDFWSIAATSENQDQAVELVNFLLSDEEAIKTIGLVLGVPPSQSARDLLGADAGSPEGKAIKFVESLDGEFGEPPQAWPTGYGEVLNLFGKVSEDIAFGNTDMSSGVSNFVDGANQALAGG